MHACECAAGMDDRLQRVFWGLFVFAAAVPGDASRGVLFVGGQIFVLLIPLSYCFHPAFIPPPPLTTLISTHAHTVLAGRAQSCCPPPLLSPVPCLSVSAPSHYPQAASPTPSASPPLRSNNVPQTCAVRLIGSERSSPTTR